MKTYSVKKSEITREWYVVDADGMVLEGWRRKWPRSSGERINLSILPTWM